VLTLRCYVPLAHWWCGLYVELCSKLFRTQLQFLAQNGQLHASMGKHFTEINHNLHLWKSNCWQADQYYPQTVGCYSSIEAKGPPKNAKSSISHSTLRNLKSPQEPGNENSESWRSLFPICWFWVYHFSLNMRLLSVWISFSAFPLFSPPLKRLSWSN